MLKNYLKIAIRSLIKNKVYSFINITCLSIGLACVLVIVSYVNLELSYDKFHENHEDIYRVTEYRTRDGNQVHTATSFSPLSELIEAHVPSAERVVKMYPLSGLLSVDKINKFKEGRFTLVDSCTAVSLRCARLMSSDTSLIFFEKSLFASISSSAQSIFVSLPKKLFRKVFLGIPA